MSGSSKQERDETGRPARRAWRPGQVGQQRPEQEGREPAGDEVDDRPAEIACEISELGVDQLQEVDRDVSGAHAIGALPEAPEVDGAEEGLSPPDEGDSHRRVAAADLGAGGGQRRQQDRGADEAEDRVRRHACEQRQPVGRVAPEAGSLRSQDVLTTPSGTSRRETARGATLRVVTSAGNAADPIDDGDAVPDRHGSPASPSGPDIVVVMGVSGSGKTTLARGIAAAAGWEFAEGDDFHPAANVAKMSAGQPLADNDRWPWLEAVGRWIGAKDRAGESAVVTCSALRRDYRDVLRRHSQHVRFLHVTVTPGLIEERMVRRTDHFMPASLLPSQLDTLEPLQPDEPGVVVTNEGTTQQVLDRALDALGLRAGSA
jgi:gluconokinase